MREIAWYNAADDEIYFSHIHRGEIRISVSHYKVKINGVETIIPDALGLIYFTVKTKRWIWAIERGYLIKLGML